MLRLFKKKFVLLLLATVVILIVIGVSSNQSSSLNTVGNIISVPFTPVQRFFTFIGQKVEGSFTYFKDIQTLKQENESLKTKIDQMEKDNRDLARFRQENETLRETLKLKDQFNNYDYIGGNMIAKDAGNFFNVFTIDSGSNEGVTVDSPVITSKGLVGSIIGTSPFTSKVISVIDSDSTVFAVNSRTMELVRVKGDLKLKDQGLCKMDYSEKDIEVGDSIETSGLDGRYPKGIVIGTVIEVKGDENQFDRYAIIQPAVNFKQLQSVFVLKSKSNNLIGTGSAKK